MTVHPVGIDLGTTYSAAARLDVSGRSEMIPNTNGQVLTPSVVLFDQGSVLVGRDALRAGPAFADRMARWVKRDMGNPTFSQPLDGHYLPPEAIQACILKQLRDDIERVVGSDFKVVVTVPAFFDETRRRATIEAATMAGLPLLDIVNEPTAAALAFGEKLGYLSGPATATKPLKVVVYDLGGGTFDVTVVELAPGQIRTLATDGDVHLGGYDWDLRLANLAAEEFAQKYQCDPRDDLTSRYALLQASEEAKLALSARHQVTIRIAHGGKSLQLAVSRLEFERITEDLLHRTAHTTRQTLAAAGLTWTDIDQLLLVGGATRMPMVSQMLQELSGQTPHGEVHPDEAVARGAALYAAHLLGHQSTSHPSQYTVSNVSAHSLGVEGVQLPTRRRRNRILIPHNTQLPACVTKKFVTHRPGQGSIVVQVLEGESLHPSGCIRIGRAVIRGLPPNLPPGSSVKVTFEYSQSGRLNVQARIPGTDCQTALALERSGLRTSSEVASWREVLVGSPTLADLSQLAMAELERGDSDTNLPDDELSLLDDDFVPDEVRQ